MLQHNFFQTTKVLCSLIYYLDEVLLKILVIWEVVLGNKEFVFWSVDLLCAA
jgi:hypothetical protein